MENKIYENSVLDEQTENIKEQETEFCEDAARNVIGVVTCLDELEIDMGDSNDDWYAVCTATGIEGFCMKKFVAVRQ